MNIEHIQQILDSIECNLQIGGIANPNQRRRALLVGEIEDLVIVFGEIHGLREEHNEFHGVMDALRRLRGSITPKQCFNHKKLVAEWLIGLDENVR